MLYDEWGFTEPPFLQKALPASDVGDRLLVGRARIAEQISRRLAGGGRVVSLEGPNGVGKTSLVNVVAYRNYQAALNDHRHPLLIPCTETFQLSPDMEIPDFIRRVHLAIAQTLVVYSERLQDTLRELDPDQPLARWLNHPQTNSYSGGLGPVQFGVNTANNETDGFLSQGLPDRVRKRLSEIFPNPAEGGVVCVLDNLELLQESAAARRILETLRDPLLTMPGTRWVLCGALGIVQGVAASPRFDGLIHEPIEVGGLADETVPEVLASRVAAFAIPGRQQYLPLDPNDFDELYTRLGKNLRSLLGKVDDYCHWCADEEFHPDEKREKRIIFKKWLSFVSEKAETSVSGQLTSRGWEIFDRAIELGGAFSPQDHAEFGCNSPQALRPYVRQLEVAGLVASSKDEGDKRRKTIDVVAKGWLVNIARRG